MRRYLDAHVGVVLMHEYISESFVFLFYSVVCNGHFFPIASRHDQLTIDFAFNTKQSLIESNE